MVFEHEFGSDSALLINIVRNDVPKDIPKFIDMSLRIPYNDYLEMMDFYAERGLLPSELFLSMFYDMVESEREREKLEARRRREEEHKREMYRS